MATLDSRLTAAGLTITPAQLVDLWADHCPPFTPTPSTCPGCGHSYLTGGPLCPTAAVVRPLLRRRRHESTAKQAMKRLTYIQYYDLTTNSRTTTDTAFAAQRSTTAPVNKIEPEPVGLFDTTPYRIGGAR